MPEKYPMQPRPALLPTAASVASAAEVFGPNFDPSAAIPAGATGGGTGGAVSSSSTAGANATSTTTPNSAAQHYNHRPSHQHAGSFSPVPVPTAPSLGSFSSSPDPPGGARGTTGGAGGGTASARGAGVGAGAGAVGTPTAGTLFSSPGVNTRKSAEDLAKETQAAVQAALAAVNDPNSSKAPFEANTAPMLKSQVKQLSRQFGSVLRQSSSMMYRSLKGGKLTRGNSMISDTDDTNYSYGFDDADDIPLHEIDEMDCLKNASVKILLSFIEFLENGEYLRYYVY